MERTDGEREFAGLLLAHLQRQPAPAVGPGSARASEAGACARKIWYRIHGQPESNPTQLRGHLAMRIGSHLGSDFAAALQAQYPNGIAEAYWQLGLLSGHADFVYRESPVAPITVVEFKTTNPNAWRYLTGPKDEHVLQLQLNAYALSNYGTENEDLVELRLIYVNISPRGDEGFLEFNPEFDPLLAQEEIARLHAIATMPALAHADYSPDGGDWQCSYCPFLAQCRDDGND